MDDKGRDSGHLMLITPERVFYAGLLGRPRQRCSGALHVYVSVKGALRLSTADGREASGELVAVPSNVRHTIASDHPSTICVLIEPETIPAGISDELTARVQGPDRELFVSRIRSVYDQLLQQKCRKHMTSAQLDTMCFGESLPKRSLDSRVVKSIAQMMKF